MKIEKSIDSNHEIFKSGSMKIEKNIDPNREISVSESMKFQFYAFFPYFPCQHLDWFSRIYKSICSAKILPRYNAF